MTTLRSPALAPYLVVPNARGLVHFLVKALDAKVAERNVRHDGSLGHTEVLLGDSVVMLGDAPQGRAPFPAMLHLYVPDADVTYARALEAGATPVREPETTPQGERRGGVRDAWGNEWWFATPAPLVLPSAP